MEYSHSAILEHFSTYYGAQTYDAKMSLPDETEIVYDGCLYEALLWFFNGVLPGYWALGQQVLITTGPQEWDFDD